MEPADFVRLEALAAAQQVSVGELIRRAVSERYLAGDDQRQRAASALISLGMPVLPSDQLEGALTVGRSEGLR